MKLQKLIGPKRQGRVGMAGVIAELNFADTRGEVFDNGADLAAHQAVCWHVFEQRNNREQFMFAHRTPEF